MKLWDKGYITDKKIDLFTVGNDRTLDLVLAKYDIKGSIAHAKMLLEIGVLTGEEGLKMVQVLEEIGEAIHNDQFAIEDEFEDMHSKIEYLLIKKLGATGKKIHTARSRNDQVLVALHLYFKDEIHELIDLSTALFDVLMRLAKKHQKVLMPGYTHLQVAMPSSFGLWFSSYAESLIDDLYMLLAAQKIVDQNPLGSAAGYGSSFPIDRDLTTELLGFETLKYNVIAAQMSRGKAEKNLAYGMSNIAATISKLAMDICLYMSQNFDFISFPDTLTTGSSIMPHKKNPDVFELIRGKCNVLQTIPGQLGAITNNLPSGYHRDLQLTKEIIIPAVESLKSCLEMMIFSIEKIKVNPTIVADIKYKDMFSVDALNDLVQKGIPFREAYQQIAKLIAEKNFTPSRVVQHSHKGSLGNLCLDEIEEKFEKCMKR